MSVTVSAYSYVRPYRNVRNRRFPVETSQDIRVGDLLVLVSDADEGNRVRQATTGDPTDGRIVGFAAEAIITGSTHVSATDHLQVWLATPDAEYVVNAVDGQSIDNDDISQEYGIAYDSTYFIWRLDRTNTTSTVFRILDLVDAHGDENGRYVVKVSASDQLYSTITENAVYTTGSYADPDWITSLAWGKVSKTGSSLSHLSTRLYSDLQAIPTTFTPATHAHAASDVTSATFADARIAESNVTQHQAALALAGSQITSSVVGAAYGGTALDTSAATGVPIITAGTWSAPTYLAAALGGTGINSGGSTGVAQVAAGVWSAGTTLQTAVQDNITRLGTLTNGPGGLTAGSVLFHNGTTLAQSNANLFWDNSNSRLGIGTATPGYTLSVLASGTINAQVKIQHAGKTGGAYLQSTDNFQAILGGGVEYAGGWVARATEAGMLGYGLTGPGTGVGFYADTGLSVGSTYTPTERMRILNTGNVGIGTATPVSLFSVGASSQFQVNTTGVVVAGTWQGGAVGAVYGGTALNTSGSSGLPSINAGTWAVNNVLTAGRVLYGAASNTVASSANLYFDGTKLGIGTASPVANSALTLDNGANAYGLIIQNTGDDAGWQLRPGGTAQVYATGTTAGVFSLEANTEIRFRTSSAQQVAIASTGVVSFKNYSFPLADGTNDQVMTTNGSGSLTWSDKAGGGGGGITSLEGQTGAAQVFTDDTNVTIVSASNAHVITWAGTLAAARLNANVAQAITNDTNVTGSIAAQNLTLGWTGQLAVARGGTGLATLAAGRIPYGAGTSAFANSANLTFDGNALTITPTTGAYRALNLTQNGLGGAPGAAFVYNNCTLVDDNLDAGAVAAKVNQLALTHTYGGVAMRGGRNTLEVTSAFGAASHASNPDRNYVAGVFSIWANDDDGGGAGTEKGAFFALAGNAIAATGAVNLVELAWCEINMQASTGSSMLHKVGVSIANYPDDVVQGSTTDAAISISRQAGGGALSTTIGWDHGVLFSNMNGQYPMATDGTLFGVTGASTVAYGIDFNGWTITGAAWRSTSGNVAFAAANQGVELGAPGSANTPYLDFHSSGNDIDYDSRIIASGGSAVVGAGRLIFTAGSIQYGVPLVGLGGGAAATLGTIGGSGPTVAAQNTWMEWIDSTGATCWVPVWK